MVIKHRLWARHRAGLLGGEIKIHKTLEMEALEDRRGIIVIFFYSSVSSPEKRGIATHHESFTTEH